MRKCPKNETPKKIIQNARFSMVLFEQSHKRTKIGETIDGKSVCRMHTLRAACNEHNWTCSVPWLVFLLCVKTLQMTMTIRQGETTCRGHMPRDGSAVKASNAGSNAQSSYYRDVRGSDQTSLRPEVSTRTPDLDHVKSGSTAHDGCAKSHQKMKKSAKGSDHVVLGPM